MAPKTANNTTKEAKVEDVKETTAQQMEVNTTVTQEQFGASNMLDILTLNNELNSMNQGELRFKVVKTGFYEFPKTDKKDTPIQLKDEHGAPQYTPEGEPLYEMIKSPYVEVSGEGISGKISTKRLEKQVLETLQANQSYFGTFMLVAGANKNIEVEFTSVVPFNQELKARMKHLEQGA